MDILKKKPSNLKEIIDFWNWEYLRHNIINIWSTAFLNNNSSSTKLDLRQIHSVYLPKFGPIYKPDLKIKYVRTKTAKPGPADFWKMS